MKLFSRLFTKPSPVPAPPQPTLDERNAAIGSLADGEALRRLAGLLESPAAAADDGSAALERAAQARVAALVDDGAVDFAGLLGQSAGRPALFAVAALCKDGSRLRQALDSIDDPQQLARLVVENPSSRLRQLAAELIDAPAQLRELLKQVRGKDKNVYRIIKQKCDALNAEERKAAEIQSEINAFVTALERHSLRTYDALYTSTLEQLAARWRLLTQQPEGDVAQRCHRAMDRCKEVIAAHLRQLDELTARQAAESAAQRAAQGAQDAAQRAAREAAAAQAEVDAQLQMAAAAARAAEESARAEKLAAEEQFFRRLGGLIRSANSAISDGNTKRAAGLRRAIDEKLPSAPVLPPYLVRDLQNLDGKLHELKEWKDYAVAPKRVELVEEMETLIGSTEEPRVLAERIKSLQQEWRTISQGIVSEAPGEWERFHRAAQAAYQPCHDYFEAQAKVRQGNLDKRKAVLERLTAFEATQHAENPDRRLLVRALREAPQEWRRHSPVEREAARAVQEEFDGSMGRLQAMLDGWYAGNVADKLSLIERARQSLAQDDSRAAIDAVKHLQVRWKATGPAPRDQDQSLWSEFRELCDAVYQKRQQAFADYTAALEINKVKAVVLCEEAERIAASSGTALLEAGAKIAEWRTAFEALGEMPRAEARALQERFARAADRCEAQLARQRERDAEQSIADLFDAVRHIQAYAWAVAQGAESAECETLKHAAEIFIAGVPRWPKEGLQALTDALARAATPGDEDGDGREKALRLLCVRAEIQSDAPTPPEDEALRRDYQVQRLMRGMGQGNHAQGDWHSMLIEWIRSGAVAPAAYAGLQSRFLACRPKTRVDRR